MALYRTVQMSFWTDSKVIEEFTPEDRYFYIYLFTNPHTNLCGCYEISKSQMTVELGYSIESINKLIERFEKIHKVLIFNNETREILLLNWHKYNWTSSEKFRKALLNQIENVKKAEFKEYLMSLYNGIDTVSIPYQYPIDTSVTVTVSNTNTNLIDLYNTNCTLLPVCTLMTKTRLDKSKELLQAYNEAEIIEVFQKANKCHWLTGENDSHWKADFDWLINIDNFVKVQEGRYDGLQKKQTTQSNSTDMYRNCKKGNYDFAELERDIRNRS